MKEQLIGKNKGISTLEIIIAFAILILGIGAILTLTFGSENMLANNEERLSGILKNKNLLGKIYQTPYDSITPTSNLNIPQAQISQCGKNIKIQNSWSVDGSIKETDLESRITDRPRIEALGGDCIYNFLEQKFDSLNLFNKTNIPTKPTTIDTLDNYIYIGTAQAPYLAIFKKDDSGISMVQFNNNFNLNTSPNHIDVIKKISGGETKIIAFLAMNAATNQLQILDLTDPSTPTLKATKALSPCVAGSAPQGWRLEAYQNSLYIFTRFTAGPEFHVFNIENLDDVYEYGNGSCKGFELGDTAEDIVVKDKKIDGENKRFVYLATDESDQELRVLDASIDSNIKSIPEAKTDLPGLQDGQSLFLLGDTLYFGRQSTTSGPELYLFDTTNPTKGLPILQSAEIGTGVNALKVLGKNIFLITPKSGKELQIWTQDESNQFKPINTYSAKNLNFLGIDIDEKFLYIISQITGDLQILYGQNI